MDLKTVMTQPVRTCRSTAPLADAAHSMLVFDCGCLPVVDARRRLVGMVTDRDVCLALARGQNPWDVYVRDVMSSPVVSCLVTDHLEVALVAMKAHRVRRVPVVDEAGRVKGIVSIDDCIRHTGLAKGCLPAELVVDVLRHVCGSSAPALADATG